MESSRAWPPATSNPEEPAARSISTVTFWCKGGLRLVDVAEELASDLVSSMSAACVGRLRRRGGLTCLRRASSWERTPAEVVRI